MLSIISMKQLEVVRVLDLITFDFLLWVKFDFEEALLQTVILIKLRFSFINNPDVLRAINHFLYGKNETFHTFGAEELVEKRTLQILDQLEHFCKVVEATRYLLDDVIVLRGGLTGLVV